LRKALNSIMPLDQIDVDQQNMSEENEMSFLEHLEELRWHIIRSVVSILIFGILSYLFRRFIFDNIFQSLLYKDFITYDFICQWSETLCFYPENISIKTLTVHEKFISAIKMSFIVGFVTSFPYIVFEIWKFIKPGLYDKEKKAMNGVIFISSFLFFCGVIFGYFIVSPFAISFLANFEISAINPVVTEVTIDSVVGTVFMLVLPTGIIFQLPLAVYFLSKMGIVTPEGMKKYRRHAFIVILILAAIITPPDITTQFLIGVPLFVLYELSIAISARVIKNQQKADANK